VAVITREEGIKQIDEAEWERDDEVQCLNLYVADPSGRPVHAWLTIRPYYCDRGHIQLQIDGPLGLDGADSFPRFFFNFPEADHHTRTFLKWRIWQERTYPDMKWPHRTGGAMGDRD
jgi:hypothetical protein